MDEPTQDILFEILPLHSLPLKLFYAAEDIDSILDDQIVSTRDGGTRCYLIKWKERPESENSWITEKNFRQLDPALLECYHSQQQLPTTHLMESSSSHPRGINEDITPLRRIFDRVYFRK